MHVFVNQASPFNLNNQIQFTQKLQVSCSCLLQQDSRIFIATEQKAIMYDLATMNMVGEFPMQEIATCVRAFEKTPDTFYLGVTD